MQEKVHQRETLGIGGRRVLISRDWSGKTLADHKADARDWVKALLGVSVDLDAVDTNRDGTGGATRYAWELARPNDPDVPALEHRLLRNISERARWRSQLLAAKDAAAQQLHDVSATDSGNPSNGED